ncbi:putative phage abortive infection protein [Acinetobacter pittii]|uniref:putative phage abortive infection protein n=1 Tax=Acinetobacter pittii TaxID=48296 RepID=UPI002A07833D|nr:putative phage abortive infection protein [Acinetobacter pittii]MDX8156816.1 putative phage abortive infection protein [Acinetobacter pittii]
MKENENNSNKDLEKIDQDINFHRIIIFLIIIAVVFFYLIMKDVDVKDAAQHWGPVGDFFGGILNPIFALFAFYWLTYSVRLQIKELKETREELKKAAAAQEESARHQKSIADLEHENVLTQKKILELQQKTLISQKESSESQKKQIEMQSFESLFFELLKTKNNMLNDVTFSHNFFDDEEHLNDSKIYIGKEAFREGVRIFKNDYKSLGWLKYYNTYLIVHWSTYFNLCFYIISIIDRSKLNLISESNDILQEDKKRKYFEIFKVTFSQYELEALFFLLIFETKYISVKKRVEKYSMFSFLDVDHKRHEDKNSKLTSIAYLYDEKAFGNNPNWKKYFSEIMVINLAMTEKDTKQLAKMLVEVGYLIPKSKFYPYVEKIKFSIIDNYEVNINSNDNVFGNIITSYNKDLIKNYFRSSYFSLVSQIKNRKKMIDDNNKVLGLIKKNCILSNEYFEIEKQYKVDGYKFIYIPRDLYDQINNYKKEISKLKDELMELDVIFEKLENSKYLETVLVLLKYQIDFDDFKKYFS